MAQPIVIVGGALANKPWNAGEAWVRLSWILGFRRLGVRTVFVEELKEGAPEDAVPWYRSIIERFGLRGDSALLSRDRRACGMAYSDVLEVAANAAAIVNISGTISDWEVLRRARRRVYVDVDPGFTQMWHAEQAISDVGRHDLHYTVGTLVGTERSRIPSAGIAWRPLLPPVVLAEWPAVAGGTTDFTTIGSWRGAYGPITIQGTTYGLKAHEFRRFLRLPRMVSCSFELALDIDPADSADRTSLMDNGWRLTDPRAAAGTPDAFRAYVQRSRAEFSVAKAVYVHARSGWFSDRTAHYLASGKPAVVQDTGFPSPQRGLLTFADIYEAAAAVEAVGRDYGEHAEAARRFAEESLDSDLVLARVLDDVGA